MASTTDHAVLLLRRQVLLEGTLLYVEHTLHPEDFVADRRPSQDEVSGRSMLCSEGSHWKQLPHLQAGRFQRHQCANPLYRQRELLFLADSLVIAPSTSSRSSKSDVSP